MWLIGEPLVVLTGTSLGHDAASIPAMVFAEFAHEPACVVLSSREDRARRVIDSEKVDHGRMETGSDPVGDRHGAGARAGQCARD